MTSPMFKQFTDMWMDEYSRFHGRKYFHQGPKDGKATKKIIESGIPVESLIETAKEAWKKGSVFPFGSSTSIAGFVSQFNEISSALSSNSGKKQCKITGRWY